MYTVYNVHNVHYDMHYAVQYKVYTVGRSLQAISVSILAPVGHTSRKND